MKIDFTNIKISPWEGLTDETVEKALTEELSDVDKIHCKGQVQLLYRHPFDGHASSLQSLNIP